MDRASVGRWVRRLIAEGRVHDFYISTVWIKLAAEVKRGQHNECQRCKAAGRYSPAEAVHHRKYLRAYPELALDMDNLECLCGQCHWDEHHETEGFSNAERW